MNKDKIGDKNKDKSGDKNKDKTMIEIRDKDKARNGKTRSRDKRADKGNRELRKLNTKSRRESEPNLWQSTVNCPSNWQIPS